MLMSARRSACTRLAILPVILGTAVLGIPRSGATASPSDQDPVSGVELVRAAVANEVAASNDPTKHMFRSHKQTPQGSQTRLYVETQQAMAGHDRRL